MYHEGVEWNGAASATEVSTEYFGPAQQQKMQSPHLCLLRCLSHQIRLQSQHGMEGKATMTLIFPYQYMLEYDTV